MPDIDTKGPQAGVLTRLKDIGSGAHAPVVALDPGSMAGGATSVTIMTIQTNATGANWTAFASQACTQLDIVNDASTAVDIEYRRNGAGNTMRIAAGAGRLIAGITNANQISIRRVDQSNTQVTLNAEAIT